MFKIGCLGMFLKDLILFVRYFLEFLIENKLWCNCSMKWNIRRKGWFLFGGRLFDMVFCYYVVVIRLIILVDIKWVYFFVVGFIKGFLDYKD